MDLKQKKDRTETADDSSVETSRHFCQDELDARMQEHLRSRSPHEVGEEIAAEEEMLRSASAGEGGFARSQNDARAGEALMGTEDGADSDGARLSPFMD